MTPRPAAWRACRVAFAGAAVWVLLSGMAAAHSFTAGLLVAGADREAALAEAVRGFLLAADERDGHANETSDGHLGGVDVQLLPLPRDAAGLVTGLNGTPDDPADVVVVLGAGDSGQAYQAESTVLVQDLLADGWDSDAAAADFVARYRLAFGAVPGVMAATAYHAARRLDVAIRPLDGVVPPAALQDGWQATGAGLPW